MIGSKAELKCPGKFQNTIVAQDQPLTIDLDLGKYNLTMMISNKQDNYMYDHIIIGTRYI